MHQLVQTTAVLLAVMAALVACTSGEVPPPPPATTETPADAPPTERLVGPLSEADAAALAVMNDRIRSYVSLHMDVEGRLPSRGTDDTPQQIDTTQRMFEQQIRAARSMARQGDIFTPEAQAVIKLLLASVFAGPAGRQLKASIMDENPTGILLAVNARYPDNVPISTMPPEVLQTLPELTEDLEYRFINDNLILLDAHAHVIADFIENAIP
jgi:hypothetical protein